MIKCKGKEFLVREYIVNRKSTAQIAKEIGTYPTTVARWLRKYKLLRTISEAKRGKYNNMWKGNKVGYNAVHAWVNRNKPRVDKCQNCGKESKKLDLANLDGKYNRDLNNYKYFCRRCHMKYDYKMGFRLQGA